MINSIHDRKSVSSNKRLKFILGPCSMESESIMREVASEVASLAKLSDIEVVFKASFDKANRTSGNSYRSFGLERGLQSLKAIKDEFGLPVTTDVHETIQVQSVAEVVDVLQVPAFLCRQTDLLEACGNTGLEVNIKKGQFMAPEDMRYAVEKVKKARLVECDKKIYVTERGTTFGYHNLVVDFRSLPILKEFTECIFDVTHSTQRPGGMNGSSGGDRKWAPYLAHAAAAIGVDGFFIETHPDPEKALSDGPLMIPLAQLRKLVLDLIAIDIQARELKLRS